MGVATYIPSIILLSAESLTVSKMDQVSSFIESVLEIADKPVIPQIIQIPNNDND